MMTSLLTAAPDEVDKAAAAAALVPDVIPGAEAGTPASVSGIPETPDGYCLTCAHPLLASDPEINAKLHAAGFTQDQAQLVYDLAAERVLPVIETLAAEFEADKQLVHLIEAFGGEERWQEASRQMLAWGKANLPPEVMKALATTADGVMALHRMMQSGEPGLKAGPSSGEAALDESGLKALMRDPRYWRTRDPGVVSRVRDGFRRLYPDQRG